MAGLPMLHLRHPYLAIAHSLARGGGPNTHTGLHVGRGMQGDHWVGCEEGAIRRVLHLLTRGVGQLGGGVMMWRSSGWAEKQGEEIER